MLPAALAAFSKTAAGLTSVEAAAPTPALAAKLTKARLRRLLVKAGRQRYIDTVVDRLHAAFGAEQLCQPPPVSCRLYLARV